MRFGFDVKKYRLHIGGLVAALALTALWSATDSTESMSFASKINCHQEGDKPVTVSISDLEGGFATDISSDGLGSYSNGNGIKSVLLCNAYNRLHWGDFVFQITTSSRRVTESFDQNDAVLPGDPHYVVDANPPFWGAEALPVKLQLKCTFEKKSLLTMTAGASITCGLLHSMKLSNGEGWARHMAPVFTGFPEATQVQIDCHGTDSSGCNDWTLRPIPGTADGDRAVARTKTSQKESNNGAFYTRFNIRVTRP